MRLNIFDNVISKTLKETDFEKMVEMMRTSDKLHRLCQRRRDLITGNRKEEADIIKKKQIPAFAPAAFLYGGKGRDNVLGLTGICFMELDHIGCKIESLMETLKDDSHILLAMRSVSGDGIHFFARYTFRDMELPNYATMSSDRLNHTYGAVFKTIKNYYRNLLKAKIDESGANMERLCILSYDPELYYYPQAMPFTLIYDQHYVKRKPKTLQIV